MTDPFAVQNGCNDDANAKFGTSLNGQSRYGLSLAHLLGEKGRDLIQFYDKSPLQPKKNPIKQSDNTKKHQKLRLHNDSGPT